MIDGKEVVISSDIITDFRCKIKQKLYANLKIIMILISFFLICIFLFISYKNHQKNNRQARYYCNSLLMYLKNTKASQSKDSLKRELNIISHNKSNRLWNKVEEFLSKSPHIQHFNNNGNLVYRYNSF